LELDFSRYDFWNHLHNFWKRFSFKSENPPGSNCYVHPVPSPRSAQRDRQAGPRIKGTPPVSRTRAEATVDCQFLADGKVADDEVPTTTLSSPACTRRGNQVKEWRCGASLAAGMADAAALPNAGGPSQATTLREKRRRSSVGARGSCCLRKRRRRSGAGRLARP
jgi:hypothetical protein